MANGPAVLTTALPEEERGKVLGIGGSVVSAGFLTGPILGGFLVEHLGWRSIFFINLPIGAIGIYLSSKVLEKEKTVGKGRVDFWGALLFFFFVTSLLFLLNRITQGSAPLQWVGLSLVLVWISLFIIVELKSSSPLVDLKLFRRRLFISSLGASFLSFWMSGAHTFVIPFFLQNRDFLSPSFPSLSSVQTAFSWFNSPWFRSRIWCFMICSFPVLTLFGSVKGTGIVGTMLVAS